MGGSREVKVTGNANVVVNGNNSCIICREYVQINGVVLPPAPGKGSNVTTINNKVYINGYEYKNGKWRRTLKALWHLWF